MTIRRQVITWGKRKTDFRVGTGACDDLPRLLNGVVAKSNRSMLVHEADADAEQLQTVRRSLIDAGFSVEEFVLALDQGRVRVARTGELYDALGRAGFTADDLLVGFGTSATCGFIDFCAQTWLGGCPSALIPATFEAMCTAATGMKPMDAGGLVGSVSCGACPSLAVCDLEFARDASFEDVALGYVELVVAAMADSRKNWDKFLERIPGLTAGEESETRECLCAAHRARAAVRNAGNPSARCALMFGSTASRALEACLPGVLPAYQLRAEGLRFEARLAVDTCDFPADDMFAIDDALFDLGIEEAAFELSAPAFMDAMRAVRLERSNRFLVAMPHAVGSIRLRNVDDEVFERHAGAYLASRAELMEAPESALAADTDGAAGPGDAAAQACEAPAPVN